MCHIINNYTFTTMRIKENYRVREVAGENLIVKQGESHADMTKVISLNSSALLLWNKLREKDFSLEDAAHILVDSYGITEEQALVDVRKWVDALVSSDIIA